MSVNWPAFTLKEMQTTKTILIHARSKGVDTVEGLLHLMEHYISKETHKLANDNRRSVNQNVSYRRVKREEKRQYKKALEATKQLFTVLPKCPDCGEGRLVEIDREGDTYLMCADVEKSKVAMKPMTGCGWSRLVEEGDR